MNSKSNDLNRSLGVRDATSIVIGTIIGTGIFIKTAVMCVETQSSSLVILAWIVSGILSLCGALTYAELAARIPKAGGGVIYMKEAYGDLAGFLSGWASVLITGPGSIAAYAVGAATFLQPVLKMDINFVAVTIVTFFTLLNLVKVSTSGIIQTVLTGLKIVLILMIIIAIFFLPHSSAISSTLSSSPSVPAHGGFNGFIAAMVAALWAYDGWNNVTMISGEIKNPQKNIPFSLGLGMFTVMALYVMINLAYFQALPFSEILNSNSRFNPNSLPVAVNAMIAIFGMMIVIPMSCAFIISALGAMHGSILTNARVAYGLSEEGIFLKGFHKTNRFQVPHVAVVFQGVVAILLSISGTFDRLTDYVIFSSWIFYAMTAASIFIIRKKQDEQGIGYLKSNYHTPFYPFLPAIFVILSSILLVTTLINNFQDSLIGLIIILSGVPFYYFFKSKKV